MTLCYLGLGSNLRSPERQLRRAIILLNKLPRSVIVAASKIHSSQPCGVRSQPPYSNMVISIHTSLSAKYLLNYCQRIEDKHQRLRKKRWGPRTLDIDLLLYGNHIINSHNLVVPHPEMIYRDFVLVPLLEISSTAQLPTGEHLVSYLKDCETYLHQLHLNYR